MTLPKDKQSLADWILRRLGAPLVNVEITNEQLEDVIDEALEFYYIWHYDGTQRSYRSIRVTDDMITGNDRRHQNINAPMYDITVDDNYRVGDRVMTYVSGGNADSVWIKYDSEQQLYQYNFIQDPTGIYYHAGGANLDTEFFITSDASKYLDSDFTVVNAILGTYSPNPNVISDSDGGFVLYDSDFHNVFVYNVEVNGGDWVDSDGAFVLYDSDTHTSVQYDSDDNGQWVDSENVFVLYDSDTHSVLQYDSDLNGDWVDSDSVFKLYDSDNTFVGQDRFTRQSISKQRFIRYTTSKPRFSRQSQVNGARYDRIVVKEFAKQYTWDNIGPQWKQLYSQGHYQEVEHG